MKYNNKRRPLRSRFVSVESLLVPALLAMFAPTALLAQATRNPTSKIYVADLSGEGIIDTGESIRDLTKRSVYSAQGSVIETKAPATANESKKYFSTVVFSNGTGAFFDADTRVEMKRFIQEPFVPNRNDLDVEPSISQTLAFVARGAVGLCNSRLVAGSNMTYSTPHGSVSIRGRKLVIEAFDNETRISMLEGESTVRAGRMDTGGHIVRAGEQAVVRRDPQGLANQIEIRPIPREEMPQLDERVALACAARKTVYFEAREQADTEQSQAAGANSLNRSSSLVTAFDTANPRPVQEIYPVEILPPTLPVEYTVSNASLDSGARR